MNSLADSLTDSPADSLADSRADGAVPTSVPATGERAIALFRSRAELRKAHGGLREELGRLDERLRHLEAASQRVHAQLAALESGPDAPPRNALLWHQLRGLARAGHAMVAACVADAARAWDERERSAHAVDCNEKRFAARQEAQSALQVQESRFYDVRERLDALWQERTRHAAPWRFFGRRDVDRRILAAEREAAAIEAALAIERVHVEQLDAEPTPAFPGLSLAARRELNLITIAAAEELARRLAGTPLLHLAGRAMREEGPGDDISPAECEALLGQIGRGRSLLSGAPLTEAALGPRIEGLRDSVRYGGEVDTVPVPESVPPAETAAPGAPALPNALLEDAWSLSELLRR